MREGQIEVEQFRRAEASCLLESFDVTENPRYQETKARVLAGELGLDEAIEQTVEHYTSLAATRTPVLSAAE